MHWRISSGVEHLWKVSGECSQCPWLSCFLTFHSIKHFQNLKKCVFYFASFTFSGFGFMFRQDFRASKSGAAISRIASSLWIRRCIFTGESSGAAVGSGGQVVRMVLTLFTWFLSPSQIESLGSRVRSSGWPAWVLCSPLWWEMSHVIDETP